MIKTIVRASFVVVAIAAAAGSASAQVTQTQSFDVVVPSTNTFTVSGSPILAPSAIAAGADSSQAIDALTTYSVSTNSAVAGAVTAHLSTGAVPTGTKLYVKFTATGDNTSSEQSLEGTSSTVTVPVLDGLANESVTGQAITYRFVVTPTAAAATTGLVVTFTYTPGA